ncbi:phage head morphogenesis protein [Paenibacillus foliorum]|nr:phage minor head protein [Paenibacillus foliorum]
MRSLENLLVDLDDPIEILRAIRNFSRSKGFAVYSEAAATKMVTHLFTDAGRTWRQAAKKNSRGRFIYEALQKEMAGPLGGTVMSQINRNAELIRSLPLDIARQVNGHIMAESLKGTRASNIVEQIKAFFPEASKTKAGLIARTETSKTSTALTRARSQSIGVNWYVWRTSKDARVRDAHARMEGVLVKWDSPPSPEQLDGEARTYGHYHCGDIFNCRCYPEPVIDLDLIKWPANVHWGGRIQRMSRIQFEAIM